MADVIRDVLIRGRMELVEAKLPAPDISAFTKAYQEQNRLASEQIRRVESLITAQEESAALRDEEARAAREAADAARKAAEERRRQQEAARAAAEAEKRAQDEARRAAEEAARAAREAAERQRALNDAALRGAESFRTFSDGAFTAARGLALVGLEGSSLEETVRVVADIQGKFDLVRGSIDAVRGGVQTAREVGEAWKLAGGPIALAGTRLGAVATALGPAGLIALGVAGTTAAVAVLWRSFADDADDAIAKTEKRIAELAEATKRARDQSRIDDESADRLRSIQTKEEQLQGIESRLADAGSTGFTAAINSAANIEARDEAAGALREATTRAATGPRFLTEGPAVERRQRAIQERESRQQELDALGGAVSDPERKLASEQFESAIEAERRRADLLEERRSVQAAISSEQNAERESGIRQAASERERLEADAQRARDQLSAAQRQQQIEENTRRRELDRLSPADRRFVDTFSGNLRDAASDGLDRAERQQIERLLKLVPSFRQEAQDAETIAAGGTPVERVDAVAESQTRLAEILEKLEAKIGEEIVLQTEDARLDAAAAEIAEL